jgi:hypothetical protein
MAHSGDVRGREPVRGGRVAVSCARAEHPPSDERQDPGAVASIPPHKRVCRGMASNRDPDLAAHVLSYAARA